jgi:hypothetical protein
MPQLFQIYVSRCTYHQAQDFSNRWVARFYSSQSKIIRRRASVFHAKLRPVGLEISARTFSRQSGFSAHTRTLRLDSGDRARHDDKGAKARTAPRPPHASPKAIKRFTMETTLIYIC